MFEKVKPLDDLSAAEKDDLEIVRKKLDNRYTIELRKGLRYICEDGRPIYSGYKYYKLIEGMVFGIIGATEDPVVRVKDQDDAKLGEQKLKVGKQELRTVNKPEEELVA